MRVTLHETDDVHDLAENRLLLLLFERPFDRTGSSQIEGKPEAVS